MKEVIWDNMDNYKIIKKETKSGFEDELNGKIALGFMPVWETFRVADDDCTTNYYIIVEE
jgi:hypothetical protein